MLWTTPVYRFRVPVDDDPQSTQLKEIVIDVTGSAPNFPGPSEGLKEVLRWVFESDSLKRIETVVEFGAGKLKNIPFILEEGKTVCAVEFKELSENRFTRQNLRTCANYGSKFQKLVFPNPFLSDRKRFDLALLLNVPPVMPVPAERLYLLDVLHGKLRDGKYLLWVAQKEGAYKPIRKEGRNACGDGLWMGVGKFKKTFYRYHRVEELDELMALYGFSLVRRFDTADDARLYEKTRYNLFAGLLTADKIRERIPIDDTISNPLSTEPRIVRRSSKTKEVLPNPKSLSVETLYVEKLRGIPPGVESAEVFHRTVSTAISRIFRGSLKDMEMKVETDGGVQIIDTIFTNSAREGFFHELRKRIECSYIIFEMRNISGDPSNTELQQINGRLTPETTHVGILVCRAVSNPRAVLSRCKAYLKSHHFILVLSDEDVTELLGLARGGTQDEVSDFMDRKLRKLLI